MFKKLTKNINPIEPLCITSDNCNSDNCYIECAFGEGCEMTDTGCFWDWGGDPDCQVIDI
ncbi:hypothetical protein [Thermococcus sp.]|uniref:hypothetical protein n=1 Tax=Thermococcus sp. TaxID=35749 RepID=UPI0026276D03|nr:hypothetical protein [Thermococcus sp.]